MSEIFGTRWVATFGERASDTWRKVLAGLTPEEIARGIEHCATRYVGEWPPTPGLFVRFCRPALDYDGAFLHAVEQLARRRSEASQDWSYPGIRPEALFWATANLSGEMLTGTYDRLRSRWKHALDSAVGSTTLEPIPAMAPRIAYRASCSKEIAERHIAEMRAMLADIDKKQEDFSVSTPSVAPNIVDDLAAMLRDVGVTVPEQDSRIDIWAHSGKSQLAIDAAAVLRRHRGDDPITLDEIGREI